MYKRHRLVDNPFGFFIKRFDQFFRKVNMLIEPLVTKKLAHDVGKNFSFPQ